MSVEQEKPGETGDGPGPWPWQEAEEEEEEGSHIVVVVVVVVEESLRHSSGSKEMMTGHAVQQVLQGGHRRQEGAVSAVAAVTARAVLGGTQVLRVAAAWWMTQLHW